MSKSVTDSSLKAAYIIPFIVLTIVSFVLYTIAPWILAVTLYGPVQIGDLFRTSVPAVEHAVIWNGKLCVPVAEMNMFNPASMSQSLVVIDLDTKETQQIRTRIPPGPLTMVADGPVLWCLSGSMVYRVENGNVTQAATGTTLNKQESAFLYDGRLAVIEEVHNLLDSTSEFQLLTWTGAGWQNQGRILFPRASGTGDAGEDPYDTDTATALKSFQGAVKIHVLNDGGKFHVFCSDGVEVLYSSHLEVLPDRAVSALEVQNRFTVLPDWIPVGQHSKYHVSLDKKGVMLVDQDFAFRSGGFRSDITLKRLENGKWIEAGKWERKGLYIDPQLASDGQRAFSVSLTLANKLSLTEFTESGLKETRLPPISGTTLQGLANKMQDHATWAPLPVLALYAFLANWLMARYRNNVYEFGNAAVELAPFGRRSAAKMVDWLLSIAPIIIVQRIFIGSQSDIQEWVTDQMMMFDFNVFAKLMLIALGFVVYCVAWLILLAIMQGFWKVSPGKWLFGLHVVRTTLRPCGFFRAFVRELMLAVDALFCMGWLPGAFCVGLTTCWQRMGDMVGDTIVIRKPGTERVEIGAVTIVE